MMEMKRGSASAYLARAPLASLCFVYFIIGLEAKGLLDFQGRRGVTSVARRDLCPVMFGVEMCQLQVIIAAAFADPWTRVKTMENEKGWMRLRATPLHVAVLIAFTQVESKIRLLASLSACSPLQRHVMEVVLHQQKLISCASWVPYLRFLAISYELRARPDNSSRKGNRCNERRFRQLKGPSVPVTGGSVPLTGPSVPITRGGGGGVGPFPLLASLIFDCQFRAWGLQLSGFRGVFKNIGPQLA